ncbi:hypothetical protein BH24ACT18_BH24ACT18_08490 [soil metagenome]|jgi:hypothetical protein|nr:hypothetical protein [Actinomycetota bacterium]
MMRLVTEEMPTSATKILARKLAGGSSLLLLPFFAMSPPLYPGRAAR